MAKVGYKLRCSIFAHEKDVRAVCSAYRPEGGFISGSRDVTARVWAPEEGTASFIEGHCMSGHENFVACVCVMPPTDTYPHGLIVTGSNDHNILAYTLDSPQPVFKLEGHADAVCSLAAGKFGTLLSGSWDTTAKVWLNKKNVMTLKGHTAAVWAVAMMPQGGYMLTGSADKEIKLWRAGKTEKTFKGHTDCVRGLAVLSENEFLSCANDATVRHWSTTGDCLQTYYGHDNYIYSIAVLSDGESFVTTGEDRSLRVWKDGKVEQTITHPTQSVWTVCALPNDDIVTGASDGAIRVFTRAVERMADEDVQKAYEAALATSTIPTQIGDIKTDQLPGPSALLNPGKRDGQTLMVRDGDTITAHQWVAAEGRWQKIGDVVGGTGSGKQTFMGKEYDYVFDVDIEEGKPPLKLPFNTSEDPWAAAQAFLQRNDLSPLFLDQVANFILEQTKGVELGPRSAVSDPLTGGGRYVPGGSAPAQGGSTDPFTGAGRYVPGNEPSQQASVGGTDPFTGGSRYQAAGGDLHMDTTEPNSFYPQTDFITFVSVNANGVMKKLREFNPNVGDKKISEEELDETEKLMNSNALGQRQLEILWRLLQWPENNVFPALDILKTVILTEEGNKFFFKNGTNPSLLQFLLRHASLDSTPANQMLALRSLANGFKHSPGQESFLANIDELLKHTINNKDSSNKNVQIALSTVMLNLAVTLAQPKRENAGLETKAQLLSAVVTIGMDIKDPEAQFRLLVCLGTLINGDKEALAFAKSLESAKFLEKAKGVPSPDKVKKCAELLIKQMN